MITRTGESVYFFCTYESNVTWYFQGGPLPYNTVLMGRFEEFAHTLMIENIRLDNIGNYSCRGQDNEFLSESTARLDVTSKKKFKTEE